MRGKKDGTATLAAIPSTNQQITGYQKTSTKSNISSSMIQEILGWLLIALNWPSVTDSERTTMLRYADGLERYLIDLRREFDDKKDAAQNAAQ